MRCDAGVVISASHNPYQDNGIKLFARDGYKLPDTEEYLLEQLLDDEELAAYRPTGVDIGRAWRIDDAAGRYSVFAKSAFPRSLTLDGMKVVIDCANGAGYRVAPEVLAELGAEVIPLGVDPNGLNINDGCGALHPEVMAEAVVASGADVGLALDGDADRCIMCDDKGEIIDGDQILAMLGCDLLAKAALPQCTVVATVMSNLGLDRAIRDAGGRVVRVGVGDRYVVERMRKDGLVLGGEQSGHVIMRGFSTTGDGLVTGLGVLGLMVEREAKLSKLSRCMHKYPQVLRNVNVSHKPDLTEFDVVQDAMQAVRQRLGDEGRVVVRYSGTQMMARVMVEGPELSYVESAARAIADTIQGAVG